MENNSNQITKKGIILLLGILIGLLTGVLVAFVVESKVRPKSQSVVEVVKSESSANKDTVYKYIVHQYQNAPEIQESATRADSLPEDSLYMEESFMDYMLDDDEESPVEMRTANISAEKMISRYEAPILYFDARKNAVEAPEHSPKYVEVQFWSTPIRNKTAYSFDKDVLKIKGLKFDELYVIHYKDRYYLQSGNRIYLIQPTSEFKRLTEIQDVSFM